MLDLRSELDYLAMPIETIVTLPLAQRAEAYRVGRMHGRFTVNAIRAAENMPLLDGGDEYVPLPEATR